LQEAEPLRSRSSSLCAFGSLPSLDELALEFDDVAGASESWASPGLRDRVRLLSMKLSEMSGEANARLWQSEALHTAEWTEVRALAAQALGVMNITA
jgi:hypothetical protein